MKRIIAAIAAAGVLVVGAFAATAITGTEASAQTAETQAETQQNRRPNPGGILESVLGELVDDGTLNQAQADAVKEGMVAKHDELKERREERRANREERRAQIEEWLSDGVISADELAQLPDDARLFGEYGPLADALEDGQITQAEWDAFIEQRKARHGDRRDGIDRPNAEDSISS